MRAMRLWITLGLLLVPLTGARGQADTTELRASFDEFRRTWREAWARRDVDSLAALVAEDVDWVAADGTWLKGRSAFREHHARLFAGQFREARWRVLDERVNLLDATFAITTTTTEIEGDTRQDGSARPARRSVGSRVLVRRGGRWMLQLSHNTIVTTAPSP
jgi:uncharacterized protein (TIGR02246 family)